MHSMHMNKTPQINMTRTQRILRKPKPPESSSSRTTNNDFDDDEEDAVYQSSSQLQSLSPSNTYNNENNTSRSSFNDNNDDVASAVSPKYSRTSSPRSLHSPSLSSYVNIAPMPVFRGGPDECPVKHLNRFTKVCRANNVFSIDLLMKIFPVTLHDEAELWYDLNVEPYHPLITWDEIKVLFLQAYKRIEIDDKLKSKLMTINQERNELVRSYYIRLQWILQNWPDHGLSNYLLATIFVDGLREDIKAWILPQKPKVLDDALRLAITYEQAKAIRGFGMKERVSVAIKCGFCGEEGHEERVCEIREKMRQMWLKNSEHKCSDCGGEIVRYFSSLVGKASNEVMGSEKEKNEEEVEGEVKTNKMEMMKKSQCQCLKHQCWKKRLGRSKSLVNPRTTMGL